MRRCHGAQCFLQPSFPGSTSPEFVLPWEYWLISVSIPSQRTKLRNRNEVAATEELPYNARQATLGRRGVVVGTVVGLGSARQEERRYGARFGSVDCGG